MSNNKLKTAVFLLYFAILGYAIDFFSYFGEYSSTTSVSYRTYESTTTSKSIIEACMDGTIPGGGLCFFLALMLLIAALIIDLILTVKLSKQDSIGRGVFNGSIAIGAACIILAFIQLAVFMSVGSANVENNSYDSYGQVTASSGLQFFFLYMGSFEAGVCALVGGIIGNAGENEESYYRRQAYKKKTNPSYGSQRSVFSSDFEIGDIIASKFVTSTVIYYWVGTDQFRETVDQSMEFEILEISGDKRYAKLRRLSDEKVFEKTYLASFNVKRKKPLETKPFPVSNEPSINEEQIQKEDQPSESNPELDKIALLREYKKLLDEGIIDQEDYDKKKAELL